MKTRILLFLVILYGNISFSQCLNYSQLLTAGINKITFFDSNSGFAYGHGTLMTTNDGGSTWNYVKLPYGNLNIETLKSSDLIDENSAIIVGHQGTIIKTTDKGQTWTPISLMINGLENINSVDFVTANIGYLTAYTDTPQLRYFMKTTDSGLTWTQISTNFDSSISFYDSINIRFLDEMNGFAWKFTSLFKTIDGGITWLELPNPSETDSYAKPISMIKISENNTLVISLIDGINSYYSSIDYGDNWTLISNLSPQNNVFVTSSAFDIKNNKLFVIGFTGVSVDRSLFSYDITNNQVETSLINLEMGNLQSDICFIDSNTGFIIDRGNAFWASTPGRKIIKTSNGGLNWTELDSFAFIDPSYSNNVMVLQNAINTLTLTKQDKYNGSSRDFHLYTSIDNGTTWQQKLNIPQLNALLLRAEDNYISYIRHFNPQNGEQGFSLYESFDLGTSWEHSDFQAPSILSQNSFVQLDLNTLTCNTFFGDLHISTDKGQTWSPIPMPTIPNINIYKREFKSANEIYAWGLYNNWPVNYDYYLFKSSNQGQTWEQIVTIPDNNGTDLGAIAATTIFGSDFAFVSTGGNTYYKINLNNNTYAPLPFVNPNPNQVFVGDDEVKILTDNNWLISTSTNYKISTDEGLTWTDRKCIVCSNKILHDNTTNTLISYNDEYGVERIENYVPETPIIYGNSEVYINENENYFVPVNMLANSEWILLSGGSITSTSSNFIQINWTQSGVHLLKVKYSNECGESLYYELNITVVDPLSITEFSKDKMIVYPNPFKDTFNITTTFQSKQIKIKIYSIAGQLVYSNVFDNSETISLNNLGNLTSGPYILVAENDDANFFISKLIKE